MVPFVNSVKELQTMVEELKKHSNTVCFLMNINKTKLMANSQDIQIKIEKETINYEDDHAYLGQIISF